LLKAEKDNRLMDAEQQKPIVEAEPTLLKRFHPGSSLTAAVHIATNLIPIFGILFFGWNVFALMLIYWCENLIIGFFNALKMALSGSFDLNAVKIPVSGPDLAKFRNSSPDALKYFLIPFFLFHYGFFCFVHGVFIFILFGVLGKNVPSAMAHFSSFGDIPLIIFRYIITHGLAAGILGLFFYNAVSFSKEYIQTGEYRRANILLLMFEPYGHIVALHITVLISGFVIMTAGLPRPVAVLIVGIKMYFDSRGFRVLHAKRSRQL
jgi:hypothetical protein